MRFPILFSIWLFSFSVSISGCGSDEPAKKPPKSAVAVPPPAPENDDTSLAPPPSAPEKKKIPECKTDSTDKAADAELGRREFQLSLEAFEKGDYALAAEGFTRAYVRTCSAPVLYNLGVAYEKLGDKASAIEAYELFLQQPSTSGERVDEVKRRLETLRHKR